MQRSSHTSARGLIFAALVTVAAALSCTAVVSTTASQCSNDGDCAARGPDFEGTVCSAAGVCQVPPPPAAECTKSSDCAAKGKGFVCSSRIQSCLAVESEDCTVAYGDPSADGTVLFGLLSEVGKADTLYFRQGQHSRGGQLAFREFFETSDPPRGVPSAPPAFAAADAAPSTRAETIARLGVARGKLRAAATPCWRAHAAASRPPPAPGVPDETLGMLRFHYALAVHRGEAEVENVEVLESSVVDHELDTCIRDAVAHARWPAPGPDGLLEVEDRIRIGDLTIPEAPPDPKMR